MRNQNCIADGTCDLILFVSNIWFDRIDGEPDGDYATFQISWLRPPGASESFSKVGAFKLSFDFCDRLRHQGDGFPAGVEPLGIPGTHNPNTFFIDKVQSDYLNMYHMVYDFVNVNPYSNVENCEGYEDCTDCSCAGASDINWWLYQNVDADCIGPGGGGCCYSSSVTGFSTVANQGFATNNNSGIIGEVRLRYRAVDKPQLPAIELIDYPEPGVSYAPHCDDGTSDYDCRGWRSGTVYTDIYGENTQYLGETGANFGGEFAIGGAKSAGVSSVGYPGTDFSPQYGTNSMPSYCESSEYCGIENDLVTSGDDRFYERSVHGVESHECGGLTQEPNTDDYCYNTYCIGHECVNPPTCSVWTPVDYCSCYDGCDNLIAMNGGRDVRYMFDNTCYDNEDYWVEGAKCGGYCIYDEFNGNVEFNKRTVSFNQFGGCAYDSQGNAIYGGHIGKHRLAQYYNCIQGAKDCLSSESVRKGWRSGLTGEFYYNETNGEAVWEQWYDLTVNQLDHTVFDNNTFTFRLTDSEFCNPTSMEGGDNYEEWISNLPECASYLTTPITSQYECTANGQYFEEDPSCGCIDSFGNFLDNGGDGICSTCPTVTYDGDATYDFSGCQGCFGCSSGGGQDITWAWIPTTWHGPMAPCRDIVDPANTYSGLEFLSGMPEFDNNGISNCLDFSSVLALFGCTDENACNYNPDILWCAEEAEDGSCNTCQYPELSNPDDDNDGEGEAGGEYVCPGSKWTTSGSHSNGNWSDVLPGCCSSTDDYLAEWGQCGYHHITDAMMCTTGGNTDSIIYGWILGEATDECPNGDFDDCGVCDGGNLDMDCSGNCFGDAVIDDCGVCDGDNQNQDCSGECFGNLTAQWWFPDTDRDGLGCAPTVSELSTCGGCYDWNIGNTCVSNSLGGAHFAECSCGIPTSQLSCTDGQGGSQLDNCWVQTTGDEACDCAEEVDGCGVCGGDNTTCNDCNGVPNGPARYDNCGVCEGDNICTSCGGSSKSTDSICWNSNTNSQVNLNDSQLIFGGCTYHGYSVRCTCKSTGGPANRGYCSSNNNLDVYVDDYTQMEDCASPSYHDVTMNNTEMYLQQTNCNAIIDDCGICIASGTQQSKTVWHDSCPWETHEDICSSSNNVYVWNAFNPYVGNDDISDHIDELVCSHDYWGDSSGHKDGCGVCHKCRCYSNRCGYGRGACVSDPGFVNACSSQLNYTAKGSYWNHPCAKSGNSPWTGNQNSNSWPYDDNNYVNWNNFGPAPSSEYNCGCDPNCTRRGDCCPDYCASVQCYHVQMADWSVSYGGYYCGGGTNQACCDTNGNMRNCYYYDGNTIVDSCLGLEFGSVVSDIAFYSC
jgi:hypothetical protein